MRAVRTLDKYKLKGGDHKSKEIREEKSKSSQECLAFRHSDYNVQHILFIIAEVMRCSVGRYQQPKDKRSDDQSQRSQHENWRYIG